MLTHKVLTNFSSLESSNLSELARSWNSLAARFGTPLLGFDWFHTCATTIHANDELRVVVVSRNGIVVAIAPLFIQKERGFHRLEILGVSSLYEPAGLLYEDESALSNLLHVLIHLGLPISLERIPETDLLRSVAAKIGMKDGVSLVRRSAPSAFLEIDQDWDAFLARLSSSRRYDLKRKQRKASQKGEVVIEYTNPTEGEFDKLFDMALRIEDGSWKRSNGSSLLRKPHLLQFFERISRKACESGNLRIFFLTIDSIPAAMHLAILANSALWVLKLGYRSEFAQYSPGIALSHASISYSFDNELERYEFLGSEEPWQNSWPITRHSYCTILIFPRSRAGVFGLVSLLIERLAKMLKRGSS